LRQKTAWFSNGNTPTESSWGFLGDQQHGYAHQLLPLTSGKWYFGTFIVLSSHPQPRQATRMRVAWHIPSHVPHEADGCQ